MNSLSFSNVKCLKTSLLRWKLLSKRKELKSCRSTSISAESSLEKDKPDYRVIYKIYRYNIILEIR